LSEAYGLKTLDRGEIKLIINCEMHRRDSNADLIRALTERTVDDPLHYSPLPFEVEEFENVPSIITKYVLTLEKHLQASIKFIREEHSEKEQL